MRLLIDGNILLDVLQKREPHFPASLSIWRLCETGEAQGYVSALTFANLVYVMRKELQPEQIREIWRVLGLIFRFTELAPADLTAAAALGWADFEDAVQAVTAERIHADFILTRNLRDFLQSPVPAITPAEYLERLG